MVATAFCDRRGVIEFTSRKVPDGMIAFFTARSMKSCKDTVKATARHACDGKTLLVPGVPEAVDDDHALEALSIHKAWLSGEDPDKILARRDAWHEKLFANAA